MNSYLMEYHILGILEGQKICGFHGWKEDRDTYSLVNVSVTATFTILLALAIKYIFTKIIQSFSIRKNFTTDKYNLYGI